MHWFKFATKKNKSEFWFGRLENEAWDEVIRAEKDKENIGFDMENDSTRGNPRYIELDCREVMDKERGSYEDYRAYAQMMMAGGDWENPVAYFRVQIEEASFFPDMDKNKSWRKGYLTLCYIPSKAEGNHLRKGEDRGGKEKWFATTDETEHGKEEFEYDESKLWDNLKKHCEKRVKEFKTKQKSDMGYEELTKKMNVYPEFYQRYMLKGK